MNATALPGVLMVAMEPPASMEDEFNDWYDMEHFPQRRALPGFAGASRWVCISGWPRWLAVYDLTSTDALETDAYRAVSGANSTPWSRRVLPRTLGRTRVVGTALNPAQPVSQHEPLSTCRLLAMSVPLPADRGEAHAVAADIHEKLTTRVDVQQARWFTEGNGTVWTLAAFGSALAARALHRSTCMRRIGAAVIDLTGREHSRLNRKTKRRRHR
jgi:hypothetical protein